MMEEIKTSEKAYVEIDDRFIKRTLRPDEYITNYQGRIYVPSDVAGRLQNEAAAMEFIRRETNIPVPPVLEAREHDDGTFRLVTKLVPGVEMKELSPDDQAKVMVEIEEHRKTLRGLRSNRFGGVTGIVRFAPIVAGFGAYRWNLENVRKGNYVFCHCDLSQSNVLVDPETLKITAIVDWEFAGFYPEQLEIPFYRSPVPSGGQVKKPEFQGLVMEGVKILLGLENTEDVKAMELSGPDADGGHYVGEKRESTLPA